MKEQRKSTFIRNMVGVRGYRMQNYKLKRIIYVKLCKFFAKSHYTGIGSYSSLRIEYRCVGTFVKKKQLTSGDEMVEVLAEKTVKSMLAESKKFCRYATLSWI